MKPFPHILSLVIWEESDSLLVATSLQEVVKSAEHSSEPPLLQIEQSQFPQPLLSLAFWSFHQLHCLSLLKKTHLSLFCVCRCYVLSWSSMFQKFITHHLLVPSLYLFQAVDQKNHIPETFLSLHWFRRALRHITEMIKDSESESIS